MQVARHEPGDDLAGVDADAQRELRAVASLEVVVESLEGGLHGDGGADGAIGVVLVGDGRAEDGHDGVADVLVDGPAVALDLARRGR